MTLSDYLLSEVMFTFASLTRTYGQQYGQQILRNYRFELAQLTMNECQLHRLNHNVQGTVRMRTSKLIAELDRNSTLNFGSGAGCHFTNPYGRMRPACANTPTRTLH